MRACLECSTHCRKPTPGSEGPGPQLDSLARQLAHEPTVETRNRKRLRPNPLAPWELRIGHLRVYFDVEEDPRLVVRIVAMGVKVRNRVWIGGEEVELR